MSLNTREVGVESSSSASVSLLVVIPDASCSMARATFSARSSGIGG